MILKRFEKFCGVFVFSLTFHQALGYGTFNQALTCVTPENTMGNCVPMEKCNRISFLLRTWPNPPFPPFVSDYIKRSHCGSVGFIHYGCCASQNFQTPVPVSPSNYYANQPTNYNANQPSNYYANQPSNYYANQPANYYANQPANYYAQPQTNYAESLLNSMQCGSYSGERISNGETVRLSEFPWMALLEYDAGRSRSSFLCSGTLITDRYVLTAAHCISGYNQLISIRLGEHNLNNDEDCERRYLKADYSEYYCAPPYIDVGVEQIIKHPQFNPLDFRSDIALIRLVRNVLFQVHIKPICLPRYSFVGTSIPETLIILGWGTTERGYASDVLMKALIPLRTADVCQNVFRRSLQNRGDFLCAGGAERKSTCRGDSGGPLFAQAYYGSNIRYIQYGIISGGENGCGSKYNMPGVYTNIASYMPWILSQIQP